VLKQRTHARAHALVGWLSGRLDLSVRPCGRARGVAGVGVVYQVPLRPMVIPEGDGHVGGVHSTEFFLRPVAGRECLGASGHPWR
jgi:hypothetical protein